MFEDLHLQSPPTWAPSPSRKPLPALLPAVQPILLFLALALPLSRPLRIFVFLPLNLLAGLAQIFLFTSNNPAADYGLANAAVSYLFWASDYLALSRPEQDLLRVGEDAAPARGWAKANWAAQLINSPRGIGWRFGPAYFAQAPASRRRFLLTRAARYALLYLVQDALTTYMRQVPFFLGVRPMTAQPLLMRGVHLLMCGTIAAAALNAQYTLVSLFAVGTGLSRPQDWPDLFGSLWADTSSLAAFWGKFWHSIYRRTFTSHTRALLRLLPHTSPLRQPLAVITPFFLSSILHAAGSRALNLSGSGAFKFFLSQPVGILLERWASPLLPANALGGWIHRAWVALFLAATAPFLFDEFIGGGLWTVPPVPVSVVQGVWKGKWLLS